MAFWVKFKDNLGLILKQSAYFPCARKKEKIGKKNKARSVYGGGVVTLHPIEATKNPGGGVRGGP